MSEMIDRVAQIISPDDFRSIHGHCEGQCEYCDENRQHARAKARRVIEAMREPTDAMKIVVLGDGSDAAFFLLPQVMRNWREMIDAALGEGK